MKHREYKLTDEMLVALMDAHSRGVNFSHAIGDARIPELLVPEAQDYYSIFGRMADHRNVSPRLDIFENVWAQVEPVSAAKAWSPARASRVQSDLRSPLFGLPSSVMDFIASPYAKQLFAVAGALGAFVLVISSVQWNANAPTPDSSRGGLALDPTAIPNGAISPMGAGSSPAPLSMGIPISSSAPAPKPLMATAPSARMMAKSSAPQARTMSLMAKAPASAPVDPNSDPQHLVAILSMTGTNEATPDTYIDDNYDSQLAAYDAAMVADNDTSHVK